MMHHFVNYRKSQTYDHWRDNSSMEGFSRIFYNAVISSLITCIKIHRATLYMTRSLHLQSFSLYPVSTRARALTNVKIISSLHTGQRPYVQLYATLSAHFRQQRQWLCDDWRLAVSQSIRWWSSIASCHPMSGEIGRQIRDPIQLWIGAVI
jgi:hypothetical protein